MIEYLTESHETPPRIISLDGKQYPINRLIHLNEVDLLATLGVYQHETQDGDAPLEYTDWSFNAEEKKYTREIAGTPEEIEAKLLLNYRETLSCTPIQGELALIQYGTSIGQDIIGGYDAWVESPDRTREEKAWIKKTTIWKRLDPNVINGAASIGITNEEQLDQLFELAKTL